MKSQNKIFRTAVVSLTIAFGIFTGCGKKQNSSSEINSSSGSGQIDVSSLHLISDTEEKERDNFQADMRGLALKGDFESLASQAQTYRSTKATFKNGTWKLHSFYAAFGNYEAIGTDKACAQLIAQLEKWAAQEPESITPRIALAEAYHGYAWLARGSGFGSTVTDAGEKLMEQRVAKGFDWLREAKKLQQTNHDPAFYAVMLHSFLGADVNRQVYEESFNAGVADAPDYAPLYQYKGYYLLPRWYGQDGEWEKYARAISRRTDIPGSGEIFARIALYLHDLGYFYDEFSGDDQSWEELKTSFHTIETNHPDSIEIKSIICLMSARLGDYQEARAQAKLLDGRVDLSVWQTQTNFVNALQWMNQSDAALADYRAQYKAQHRR